MPLNPCGPVFALSSTVVVSCDGPHGDGRALFRLSLGLPRNDQPAKVQAVQQRLWMLRPIGEVNAALARKIMRRAASREMPRRRGGSRLPCVRVSGITLTGFRTPSSGDEARGGLTPVLRLPGGFTTRRPGNAAGCGEKSRE
jgi:hypothetical protein